MPQYATDSFKLSMSGSLITAQSIFSQRLVHESRNTDIQSLICSIHALPNHLIVMYKDAAHRSLVQGQCLLGLNISVVNPKRYNEAVQSVKLDS